MHLGLEGIVPTSLWITMVLFFLLSIFKDPAIGLYLMIPLLPLETVRYKLHGYFLGAQFVDILLLGSILGLKRKHLPVVPKTPITGLVLAYIAFTYLSMIRGSLFLGVELPLWFSNPRVSDWKNFVVDLSLMFFVTSSAIRTKRQMGVLLTAMFLGILLLAKNFHNEIGGRDFSSFSYNLRSAGTMGGAGINGLAAFVAEVAVFVAALFVFEKRWIIKAGYSFILFATLYCVLFALSRGAYMASLVGMFFVGVLRSRLLCVTLIGFLLVWQSLVPTAVRERVFMTTDGHGDVDHSAGARLSLWEEAMQVFQADPVFGTGFETYAYGSHVGGYGDTHNLFVKVLVETGAVGLLLFVTLLGELFKIGFRLYRSATDQFLKSIGLAFWALMLTALIANFFGDRWMYFQITGYTYAFAAMAVRAQQMTDDEAQDSEKPDTELTEATDRLSAVPASL